eukprot:2301308-Alexandrium_andersonii.AAC.1
MMPGYETGPSAYPMKKVHADPAVGGAIALPDPRERCDAANELNSSSRSPQEIELWIAGMPAKALNAATHAHESVWRSWLNLFPRKTLAGPLSEVLLRLAQTRE